MLGSNVLVSCNRAGRRQISENASGLRTEILIAARKLSDPDFLSGSELEVGTQAILKTFLDSGRSGYYAIAIVVLPELLR